MSTPVKLALAAAAVGLAVVVFLVLRPASEPPAPETVDVELVVQDGHVPSVRRIEIARGADVRLRVRADVEDEVHVHGYDLMRDVAPGRPAVISFRASVPGRFEVELEERKELLAELVVTP